MFAFIACTSGVKVENPSEGDDKGAVNVGNLTSVSTDATSCVEATYTKGMEAVREIETDG